MAGNGPVEFFVDIDELGRLRSELQTLHAELDALPAREVQADAAALGADVAGAVDRFAADWTAGRARITGNLGECLALVEGAIEAYRTAESAVQNAAAPGTPAMAGAR